VYAAHPVPRKVLPPVTVLGKKVRKVVIPFFVLSAKPVNAFTIGFGPAVLIPPAVLFSLPENVLHVCPKAYGKFLSGETVLFLTENSLNFWK